MWCSLIRVTASCRGESWFTLSTGVVITAETGCCTTGESDGWAHSEPAGAPRCQVESRTVLHGFRG